MNPKELKGEGLYLYVVEHYHTNTYQQIANEVGRTKARIGQIVRLLRKNGVPLERKAKAFPKINYALLAKIAKQNRPEPAP